MKVLAGAVEASGVVWYVLLGSCVLQQELSAGLQPMIASARGPRRASSTSADDLQKARYGRSTALSSRCKAESHPCCLKAFLLASEIRFAPPEC